MSILSLRFLLFFILIFPLTIFFKRRRKFLALWLSIVSLIFYYFAGLDNFILLLLNLLTNYGFSYLISKFEKSKKHWLIISISVNVLFLATYKYSIFFLNSIQYLNKLSFIRWEVQAIELFAPLGISFFTFKNIAYLVELYKGKIKLTFIKYISYVTFSPEITSGPITNPKDFYNQLEDNENSYTQGEIVQLLLSALIKKFLIASYLFAFVSGPFDSPSDYSSIDLIIAMFSYTAMIYMDFSGYSDLAILLSKLLGLQSTINFNYPYSATSVRDFWRRWHISLSSWLRDYIYIPLGGNRKGRFRKYVNIFITMVVSGFWHGAGWTFIIWGFLHAVGTVMSYIIEDIGKFISKKFNPLRIDVKLKDSSKSHYIMTVNKKNLLRSSIFSKTFRRLSIVISWLVTFLFVSFAWIFFNASSLNKAIEFIKHMINPTVSINRLLNPSIIIVLILILVENLQRGFMKKIFIKIANKIPGIILWILVIIVIHIILNLGPQTVPPFIYFKF